MNSTWWLLFVVYFWKIQDVTGIITVQPENTAAFLHESAVLHCYSSLGFTTITWRFLNGYDVIARNCIVTDQSLVPYYTTVSNSSSGQCGLVILSVNETYAVGYNCEDTDSNKPNTASAFLAVLYSNPYCYSHAVDVIFDNDFVSMECAVSFSSPWVGMTPNMTWSCSGPVSVHPYINTTFASSSVTVQAQRPVVQCNCRTQINAPTNPPVNGAINAPAYDYLWTSTAVNVHFCPNVTIESLNGTGIDFYVDEIIRCSASAYPSAVMINLTVNGSLYSSGSGSQYYTLTSGNYTVECIAVNYPLGENNTECNGTASLDIIAISNTRPPSLSDTTTPMPVDGTTANYTDCKKKCCNSYCCLPECYVPVAVVSTLAAVAVGVGIYTGVYYKKYKRLPCSKRAEKYNGEPSVSGGNSSIRSNHPMTEMYSDDRCPTEQPTTSMTPRPLPDVTQPQPPPAISHPSGPTANNQSEPGTTLYAALSPSKPHGAADTEVTVDNRPRSRKPVAHPQDVNIYAPVKSA